MKKEFEKQDIGGMTENIIKPYKKQTEHNYLQHRSFQKSTHYLMHQQHLQGE